MNRITKKTDTKEGTTISMPKAIKAYWKLKEYEDIEEKWHIDLIARQCYFKNAQNEIIEAEVWGIDLRCGTLLITLNCESKNSFGVYQKDYGKTWALTKEELL